MQLYALLYSTNIGVRVRFHVRVRDNVRVRVDVRFRVSVLGLRVRVTLTVHLPINTLIG